VWQIRRQITTEASGVRQFKKVHHEMIRVCSETSTIVRAVAAYWRENERESVSPQLQCAVRSTVEESRSTCQEKPR
jgi:hypothetical protein